MSVVRVYIVLAKWNCLSNSRSSSSWAKKNVLKWFSIYSPNRINSLVAFVSNTIRFAGGSTFKCCVLDTIAVAFCLPTLNVMQHRTPYNRAQSLLKCWWIATTEMDERQNFMIMVRHIRISNITRLCDIHYNLIKWSVSWPLRLVI